MARSKVVSWIDRQKRDPYVKKAHQTGFRSRACYKLIELNKAEKLFKPGMSVVDLGAAPGGWSQVLVELLGKKANLFALDILEMQPIAGVSFIKGDFNDDAIQDKLKCKLDGKPVHWVISDMAPNLSGITDVDQAKMMQLANAAWQFTRQVLTKDGGFLIKLFQGQEVASYTKNLEQYFRRVAIKKPNASRDQSREIYLVAQGFKTK